MNIGKKVSSTSSIQKQWQNYPIFFAMFKFKRQVFKLLSLEAFSILIKKWARFSSETCSRKIPRFDKAPSLISKLDESRISSIKGMRYSSTFCFPMIFATSNIEWASVQRIYWSLLSLNLTKTGWMISQFSALRQ